MSEGCSDVTPPTDERCNDPAFRAANPDLCKYHPELILTPGYSLTEPGKNIVYSVILRANGEERPVTKGLSWFSSNVGAAEINQDGVATGVTAGQTTISVTWQDLSAQAQLDVVGSCADTHQNFRLLIDRSKSMGQKFSSAYTTKLSFSKTTAAAFADTINYSKDQIGVSQFAEEYNDLQPWTTDAAAAKAAVNSISLAQEKTDLAGALTAAIDSFNGETGIRVIVLFTDGEWTGDDPRPIAQAFRESGGFLCIVATASWGDFFSDLLNMASAGFLLSAYEENQNDILDSLSGLKSFLCSGSCFPQPGTAPHAKLNYDGFINWDVVGFLYDADGNELEEASPGFVDLVGLGLWDVLGEDANQGLYIDLQGTASEPPAGDVIPYGGIRSKNEFTLTAGQTYKITVGCAGNNVGAVGEFIVRVRVGSELDEDISITSPRLPMTPFEFTWTQLSTETDAKITINQKKKTGHQNVGSLVDDITLENITTPETMLFDDFNSENPTTIEPGPGYNYGCLETPPGSQRADPTPPTPRVIE